MCGERCQGVARLERAHQDRAILGGARGADLDRQAAAIFFVFVGAGKGRFDGRGGTVLECARQVLGLRRIFSHQRIVDRVGEGLRLLRQQVAADPGPQLFKHTARGTPWMLVIGDVVDNEGFDRHEKQARRAADAPAAFALFADHLPQFVEHQRRAEDRGGGIVAAQQAALELADQGRSRRRLEFAQVLSQPLDGCSVARHGLRYPQWIVRFDSRAGVNNRLTIFAAV